MLAKDNSNKPKKQQSDRDKSCFNCGKVGYFTRNCRQKQAKMNKLYKRKRHIKSTPRSVNVLEQCDEEVNKKTVPMSEGEFKSEQDTSSFTTEEEDNFWAYFALDRDEDLLE